MTKPLLEMLPHLTLTTCWACQKSIRSVLTGYFFTNANHISDRETTKHQTLIVTTKTYRGQTYILNLLDILWIIICRWCDSSGQILVSDGVSSIIIVMFRLEEAGLCLLSTVSCDDSIKSSQMINSRAESCSVTPQWAERGESRTFVLMRCHKFCSCITCPVTCSDPKLHVL